VNTEHHQPPLNKGEEEAEHSLTLEAGQLINSLNYHKNDWGIISSN